MSWLLRGEYAPLSIYCPYCLQKTAITGAPMTYLQASRLVGVAVYEVRDKVSQVTARWWIGLCNHCQYPVLVCNEGDIIYPLPFPSPTDERIPEDIRNDLDEAKKCFSVGAYRACATMARRAVQSTAIDKGAERIDLHLQIQWLYKQNIITKDIKEWAETVNWVGTDGAHPNRSNVDKDAAEDALLLAEEMLKVIYVTPAIAQERRNKRQEKK